jgi:Zn-dependent peptidase ImmA (M78 family)
MRDSGYLGIKNQILLNIKEWISSGGEATPPIDPVKLAGARRVCGISNETISQQGILIPVTQGFLIKVDARLPKVRKRAVIAHEIAHTFFYDLSKSPPRKIPSLTASAKQEEQWCDDFAGEILMPTQALEKAIYANGSPGMHNFVRILDRFDVSPEFAAWRLTQIDKWPLLIVHLRKAAKDWKAADTTNYDWKWRVFKPFSLKNKSLSISRQLNLGKPPSPIQCFYGVPGMVVAERWQLGRKQEEFVVECRRFAGSVPQVIAIFHAPGSDSYMELLERSSVRYSF